MKYLLSLKQSFVDKGGFLWYHYYVMLLKYNFILYKMKTEVYYGYTYTA